jgi:hypothetical protein
MSELLLLTASVLASFTSPEQIGVTPASMLWLLPLVAAIVIGYKANKLPRIEAISFLRESAVLFMSIILFMAVTAVVLSVLAALVLGYVNTGCVWRFGSVFTLRELAFEQPELLKSVVSGFLFGVLLVVAPGAWKCPVLYHHLRFETLIMVRAFLIKQVINRRRLQILLSILLQD